MKKQPRKTRYCEYHHSCDRDEDCLNGEYCPMFKFNPECVTLKEIMPQNFEEIMDDVWEGKTK